MEIKNTSAGEQTLEESGITTRLFGGDTEAPTKAVRFVAVADADVVDAGNLLDSGEKNPRFAPADRYNLALMLVILMGMSTAYAWNFFVTAADYFRYSFRNTTHPEDHTTLQRVFENSLAILACSMSLLGVLVNTILTRYIPFRTRILTGLSVVILVFVATTALTKVETDSWQTGFFAVTLVNVMIINFFTNVVTGGLFGISGCLPTHFATALMVGQTIAGLFATFASIASILAGNARGGASTRKDEAAGYFGSAIAMSILAMAGFLVFLKLPIINFYLSPRLQNETVITAVLDTDKVHQESTLQIRESFSTRQVFRKTWKHGASLFVNAFVTLAIFPAIAVSVRSEHASSGSLLSNQLFLPLCCFLVTNSGDCAGRLAHGFLRWPNPQQGGLTLFFSVLRIGFIPLLMLCNAQPRSHLPVLFYDVGFVLILAAAIFTNGYFLNLGIMYGPKLVSAHSAETTGSLMALCVNFGLVAGSALSFLLTTLL